MCNVVEGVGGDDSNVQGRRAFQWQMLSETPATVFEFFVPVTTILSKDGQTSSKFERIESLIFSDPFELVICHIIASSVVTVGASSSLIYGKTLSDTIRVKSRRFGRG